MQKREFFDGRAVLYCGDSFDIIPQVERFDALITDPPYSSGGLFMSQRGSATGKKYQTSGVIDKLPDFAHDNKDQRSWMLWQHHWLSLAMPKLKDGGALCLFSDWRQLPATSDVLQWAGAIWRGVAVWDKVNARPFPDRFRAQAEFIVWGTKGERACDMRDKDAEYLAGVIAALPPITKDRQHQTQKPVEVMREVVKMARRDEIVFDPFMGSGTTGIAAIEQGRRFVGVEMTPVFFDVACKRFEALENDLVGFAA
jgi:site-specific DNA-methyltransferase (adenine-specific)